MSALRLGILPDGTRHVVILEPAVGRISFSRGAVSGGAIVTTASWRDRLRASDKRVGHHGPKVRP